MDLPDKSVPPQLAPQKKVITPVVSGVKQIKRPATRRFFDYLFAESPKALGRKIGRDVVVPRVKAGFEEAANSFLSGMLWGDASNRPMSSLVRGTVLRGGVHTSYGQMGDQSSLLAAARASQTTTSPGTYRDVVCRTKEEAEIVLANLIDIFNQYRRVAVGDLYDLVGITTSPADNAYGWTSLDGARISVVRDGYSLELPRPVLI